MVLFVCRAVAVVYRGKKMSELQVSLLCTVSLIKKYLHQSPSIKIRGNCIASIAKVFSCGLARASQIFAEVPVAE
jgi:hypothetical protein